MSNILLNEGMPKENPHFSLGHMCAGCPLSNKLHLECIVEGNVRVINIGKTKIEAEAELPPSSSGNFESDCCEIL